MSTKLPPLPEPALRAAPVGQERWPFPKVGYYTAEQMRAHAQPAPGTLRFDIPIADCIVLHEGGDYPIYRCMDCGMTDYGPSRMEHKEGCRVAAATLKDTP